MNRHFTRYSNGHKHREMFNLISDKRNANLNAMKDHSQPNKMDKLKKVIILSVSKDREQLEYSYNFGRNVK